MSEIEYAGLVLEDELLDHLATPEGATAIWKEHLDPEVIPKSDEGIREALRFVQRYMDEYREPPPVDVIADETGYSEFNEPTAPVAYVIERLRDRYRRQQLREITTKIGRLSNDPVAALNYGLEKFSEVKSRTQHVGNTITHLDFATTLDDYERKFEEVGNGLSFGYEEIDEHMGGLRIGELTVILARPKRYKSWQLTKAGVASFFSGHDTSICTMEMKEEVMRNRFHCMAAGVSWYRFDHNLLTDPEKDKLAEMAEIISEQPNKLHIFRPKIGERNVGNIVAQAGEHDAKVLIIDQLSWFDGAKDEGNWRIIGKIMEELKDASMQFPIYMAAQYNRVQANEVGIGDLANIALADAIGQTADNILGIYASKDMLANKIIHLGVVDSRNIEPIAWEIKVRLSEEANFKFLNVLEEDGDD